MTFTADPQPTTSQTGIYAGYTSLASMRHNTNRLTRDAVVGPPFVPHRSNAYKEITIFSINKTKTIICTCISTSRIEDIMECVSNTKKIQLKKFAF